MKNNEIFRECDIVYCFTRGRGIITSIEDDSCKTKYPITVKFVLGGGSDYYTNKGYRLSTSVNPSLSFEPWYILEVVRPKERNL